MSFEVFSVVPDHSVSSNSRVYSRAEHQSRIKRSRGSCTGLAGSHSRRSCWNYVAGTKYPTQRSVICVDPVVVCNAPRFPVCLDSVCPQRVCCIVQQADVVECPLFLQVRLVINEKGLLCDERDVSMPLQEHKEPWFMRLNLGEEVPVFIHGDTIVSDYNQIIEYLETNFTGGTAFRTNVVFLIPLTE